VSQRDQRVPYDEALARLNQFQHLSSVLDAAWLERQYRLTVERYTLFTGWLSTSDFDWTYTYKRYVASLDSAIAVLQAAVSANLWSKLSSKIRTKSTREESKGTLAELSLAVFLVQNGIDFDMEQRLNSASKKDVDFRLNFPGAMPVHIEMQWLSDSEASERAALVSAQYRVPMRIDFESAKQRVRNKVLDKVPKLTTHEIILVALKCRLLPELGGASPYTSISDALALIFGTDISGPLTEPTSAIRDMVDGVIWFETDFDIVFTPVKRGSILNEHSLYRNDVSLIAWLQMWSAD